MTEPQQPLILICDDNARGGLKNIYDTALQAFVNDYAIQFIQDPEDALARVGHEPVPAIVLLDVVYGTRGDGLRVCRALRQWVPGPELQILALTAVDDDPSTVVEFFRAGADDYLRRDIALREAQIRIARRLEVHRAYSHARVLLQSFIEDARHSVRNFASALDGAVLELESAAVAERSGLRDAAMASSHGLSECADALIDVAALDGGRRERFAPTAVVQRAAEYARRVFRAKGPMIKVVVGPHAHHARVFGFQTFFLLAIFELLRNAITMTADTGVQPEVMVSIKMNGRTLVIGVEDNGPGIPADIDGKEFEIGLTSRMGASGTGLGLFFVKNQITEIYDGRVNRTRSERGGAAFWLNIPNVASDANEP